MSTGFQCRIRTKCERGTTINGFVKTDLVERRRDVLRHDGSRDAKEKPPGAGDRVRVHQCGSEHEKRVHCKVGDKVRRRCKRECPREVTRGVVRRRVREVGAGEAREAWWRLLQQRIVPVRERGRRRACLRDGREHARVDNRGNVTPKEKGGASEAESLNEVVVQATDERVAAPQCVEREVEEKGLEADVHVADKRQELVRLIAAHRPTVLRFRDERVLHRLEELCNHGKWVKRLHRARSERNNASARCAAARVRVATDQPCAIACGRGD